MVLPGRSRKLIEEARGLNNEDNYRDMRHWVFTPHEYLQSYNYSMIKGTKAHFIAYLNGTIVRSDMHRSRVGYWKGSLNHIASMDGYLKGKPLSSVFSKYVRGLGYIYRQYSGMERIDYISEADGSLHIQMLSSDRQNLSLSFQIGHSAAWPSRSTAETFDFVIDDKRVSVSSDIAHTSITINSPDRIEITASDDTVFVSFHDLTEAEIIISDTDSEGSGDMDETLKYHEQVADIAVLETPDPKFNKLFLWAKHDLLEFYSITEKGSGWFAGFPVYSWFFGRDGLWMALAANMVGLSDLTANHMSTLFRYSDHGRIPHEIGLGDGGDQGYSIGDVRFNTMYMSIDSSPLWLMVNASLENWSRRFFSSQDAKVVFDFCKTCDVDNDGLLENDFKRGLIGWPETWANIRNGKTVDVNALWLEVLRLYGKKFGGTEYVKARDRYMSTFFSDAQSVDFVDEGSHIIRSAMQFVPGIFMKDESVKQRILDISRGVMTPWGIRSMSVYDPMYDGGYHTGTVWPLMTGWFVMAAYNNGAPDLAFEQLRSFVDLAFSAADPGRINETYDAMSPTPTGQFAQGWSSSMFVMSVMRGMLNMDPMEFDPSRYSGGHQLPDNWDRVRVYNIPWRDRIFDMTFTRDSFSFREITQTASEGASR
ncbi:amylo-alpha-1,6-glucosidase [Thermoplasma sp. Kam2015]|uniref:amylo-alpha-1,6-glucosidase n=1 Tax=Thermoplasma sp. Kam2015 TaxID=2094122 RepID=UPI001F25523B|nr:amylo-alpha-1,6-glucosidase [Thermoplasma sp. Kam2015]